MSNNSDDSKIIWEDANLALWSDGTISIHNPVMGYERCIATYNVARTRELYEVLCKYYGDNNCFKEEADHNNNYFRTHHK